MRGFSLLVKPAGDSCNLACPYCFYRGHGEGGAARRMSEEMLAHLLTTYRALPIASHDVAFQGGEPLLMGENFFRRAAEIGEGINFSVQTNATLVTASMAKFFAEADWLVGVSPHWEGLEEKKEGGSRKEEVWNFKTPYFILHPSSFILSEGLGEKGYWELVKAGVKTNILQLVTKENVGEPEKLYHYLRDELKCNWQQYIECTAPAAFAITGEEWGEFLCRLFDVWKAEGDERRVSIRLFDSIVSQLVHGVPTMCNFARDCRNYLVVEANGDVYPCDFHVLPEFRLGNILVDSWEKLIASPRYTAFGERKRAFPDCPRNRGTLDKGWQRFFAHAVPYLKSLV